jgi:hypothetical protein
MELSPLAKERLAKIGSLSLEENEKLERSRELESLLSQYFNGSITTEDLWRKIKELRNQRGETIITEAQKKLLDTLRLQMSQEDIEQRRSAILALETIKGKQKYASLEMNFNSIEALHKKLKQTKEQGYEQLKSGMEPQLQAAAQQAIRQGINVDLGRSLEANIKNSPQWKAFVLKLEQDSETMFNGYISKLRELMVI